MVTPIIKTPIPRCDIVIPNNLFVKFDILKLSSNKYSTGFNNDERITHNPTIKPTRERKLATPKVNSRIKYPKITEDIATNDNLLISLIIEVFFHTVCIPIPRNMLRGIMGIINTKLKYGGPTEIFPIPKASRNNG